MNQRQQSSTSYPMTFLLVLSSDKTTGATGKTVTVTLSKNGGTFNPASGAVSEIGNGWYALAGNATDRNTLGEFILRATAADCEPAEKPYVIVPWDPFGANLGLSNLDAAVSSRLATTGYTAPPTAAAVRAEIDANSTKLDVAVSSRLATTGYTAPPTAAAIRTEIDANSAKLDVAISTRLADSAYTAPPSAATVADAVWDEAIAGHVSGGSTGAALNAAGSAGDPWSTALPGSYAAGTAGAILGNNLDAAVSSRLAGAAYSAPPSVAAIRTEIDANSTKLDVAVSTRLPESGYTAPPTAAAVRAEIDANSSKLDVAVSSRLAGSSYTAPNNAGIAAVQAVTDTLSLTAIADAILKRDWTGITGEASRSILNAMRAIRNGFAISGTTLTVRKEDGSTAYTRTVTTDAAAEPITQVGD